MFWFGKKKQIIKPQVKSKFKNDIVHKSLMEECDKYCAEKPLTEEQKSVVETIFNYMETIVFFNDNKDAFFNEIQKNLSLLPPFIQVCVAAHHSEVLTQLLTEHPDYLDVRRSDTDETPLHCISARARGDSSIRYLVNAGFDVNAQDNNGWTPVMKCCAVKYSLGSYRDDNQTSDFKSLLQLGADLSIKNKDNETVMDITHNWDIKSIIIERQAHEKALEQVEKLSHLDFQTLDIICQLFRYMSNKKVDNPEQKKDIIERVKVLKDRQRP